MLTRDLFAVANLLFLLQRDDWTATKWLNYILFDFDSTAVRQSLDVESKWNSIAVIVVVVTNALCTTYIL